MGMVLTHDITEIKQKEFKGRTFKKGHIVGQEDIGHLPRLGKEHFFVLTIAEDEMHEDDAAYALATALMGEGVRIEGEPKEGKIDIIADRDGLLKINRIALTPQQGGAGKEIKRKLEVQLIKQNSILDFLSSLGFKPARVVGDKAWYIPDCGSTCE